MKKCYQIIIIYWSTSSHPLQEHLKGGNMFKKYISLKVTRLIPINQGIINATKWQYRKTGPDATWETRSSSRIEFHISSYASDNIKTFLCLSKETDNIQWKSWKYLWPSIPQNILEKVDIPKYMGKYEQSC